jgi:hypothetical protein
MGQNKRRTFNRENWANHWQKKLVSSSGVDELRFLHKNKVAKN